MFKINIYLNRGTITLAGLALLALVITGSIIALLRPDKPRREAPARQTAQAHAKAKEYPYRIALTFDDGPHPRFTDRLISILETHGAKASFFIVGRQAVQYPYLLQHLSLAGHEIESHTFTHRNLSRLDDGDIRKELTMTARLIEEVTGKRSIFFRPPGGQYNPRAVSVARETGKHMVLWTVFPRDHEEKDPSAIVHRVLLQATDGGVVLLHSGSEPTLSALPHIIRALKGRGYRFVTVSELFEEKNPGRLAELKVARNDHDAYNGN